MSEFVSLPKFLRLAGEQGLEVTERTLNFYIARNLLPKPVRKPFVGADGRVGYMPTDSLRQLRKILQLKEQGLKLEQIRRTLEGRGVVQEQDLEAKAQWQRELAFRYLRHMPAGYYAPARLQLLSRLSRHSQKISADELRDFQTATLTPLVGEAEAQRYVNQFYLKLPARELERQVHSVSKEYLEKAAQGGPGQFLQNVRQAVSNRLLNRITPEALGEYLGRSEALLRQAEPELLAGETVSLEARVWLELGLRRCCEALAELRQPVKEQSRKSIKKLQAGLELLHLAQKMSELLIQGLTWQGDDGPSTP